MADETRERTTVPLTKESHHTTRQPRAPAQFLVECNHDDRNVFVESKTSLFAEVNINDANGSCIASKVSIIIPASPIILPINTTGVFDITIIIGENIYSGTFSI